MSDDPHPARQRAGSDELVARALAMIRAHCADDPHAFTRYVALRDELHADTRQLRDALRQLELDGLIEWRTNGAIRPERTAADA